eukprot:3503859-Amphidinium_carterae.1
MTRCVTVSPLSDAMANQVPVLGGSHNINRSSTAGVQELPQILRRLRRHGTCLPWFPSANPTA